MVKRFYLHDKIILIFLTINYVVITGIPGLYSIFKVIYFVQIGLFLLFFSVYLDFDYFSSLRFPHINIISLLFISLFLFFFVSSFVVNLKYNTDIESIVKLLTYPILFYLFFVHLSKIFLNNDDLFDKFLNSLVLIGFFTALIALMMYVTGIHLSMYEYAATGYFGHPNTIGFIYSISIPILFYEYFSKKYSVYKFGFILAILMMGLLLSYSRSAYIAVFVSILIITYRKSKILFVFACVFSLLLITSLFLGYATAKGDSSSPRSLLLFAAYDMVFSSGTRYLLWGYGIFHNIDVFKNEIIIFNSKENVPDPHNMLFLISIQFGILFTINFVMIVAAILVKSFFRKRQKNSNTDQKINLSLSIIIALIVHNMLEDIVVYPEFFVMPIFLIFLGYLFYVSYYSKIKNQLY